MLEKVSLKKKLVAGFLIAGLLPALSITLVTINKVKESLNTEAKQKLVAIREAKAFQIEQLYLTMQGQVRALSQNKLVKEASYNFNLAFDSYNKQAGKDLGQSRQNLNEFYNGEFKSKYEQINIDQDFEYEHVKFKNFTPNQALLQDAFITSNNNKLGEKDKLVSLDNSSDYAKLHEQYHSTFRTYLNEFGFYDIFLVDAKSGNIIYSVYKEVDFATSLRNGPYKDTGIAKAYQTALKTQEGAPAVLSDISPYYPSYNAPAQFIAAPVFYEGKREAVLIFQIPVQKINTILTSNQEWKKQGQGDSGETYIINNDLSMRSMSRFLAEDKKGFLKVMKNVGASDKEINYMNSHNTSAVAAKVKTIGAKEATSGKTGFKIFPDYRDVNVLSAYRPLTIYGQKWAILSEMDQDEALASLYAIEKLIYILLAASIGAILLLSLSFSKTISSSLVALADKLKDEGEKVLQSAQAMAQGSSDLASATQEQASSLQETSSSVSEISAMVERNSQGAKDTTNLSASSQQKAEQGKNYVSSVKSKIEDIHRNNEELVQRVDENNAEIENITNIINDISDKTKVINDIVFQTKLLSFNASVEAARAGEHGSGFSVVAQEVGALAQMSGNAAAEISALLEQSTAQVRKTVTDSKDKMSTIIASGNKSVNESLEEIETCDNVLNEILASFKEVNSAVEQIAASSQEQSAGVNEITSAVQQLDSVTQQNTSIAQESSSKADDLRAQSNNLAMIVSEIQNIVFGSK